MGRSVPVRFTVEMTLSKGHATPCVWPTKYAGRPSDKTLKAYIETFEESCRPGGCNEHLGPTTVMAAKVIDHFNGNEVRATYTREA